MKVYLLPFLMCLFCLTASGQFSREEKKLDYGNTKQVIYDAKIRKESVYLFSVTGGRKRDSILSKETFYDSLGNIEGARLNPQTPNDKRYVLFYNSNQLQYFSEENFRLSSKIIHQLKYDSLSRLTQETVFPADSSRAMIYKYIYGEDDQLETILRAFDNGDFKPFKRYFYQDNKLVKVEESPQGKKPEYAVLYEYNNANNTRTKYFQTGKRKVKVQECSFNAQGQMIRQQTYAGSEAIGETLGYVTIDYATQLIYYNTDNTIDRIEFERDGKTKSTLRFYYYK